MTLHEFLQHWNLVENPFQGEEARTDRVFGRMNGQGAKALSVPVNLGGNAAYHADFDRVMGDLRAPSSAVVFGEKGSGKTAMRLQIAARIREHNAENPDAKVLLIAHDELNTLLVRIHERYNGKTPLDSFQRIRLADHLDAILAAVMGRLTDAMLGDPQPEASIEQMISIGPEPKKAVRRLDPDVRRDLLLLQALYDRPGQADERTRRLRRRLGIRVSPGDVAARVLLVLWPLAVIAFYIWSKDQPDAVRHSEWVKWALITGAGAYGLMLIAYLSRRVIAIRQMGRRMRKQIPSAGRGFASFARSLGMVDGRTRSHAPTTDAPETRYALLDRLRRAMVSLCYAGIVVVIDRVDEPPLISGDMDRMKAVIWPLLNNRLLQLDGIGVKMLLPIELRHALYKESNSFFQEARLDKQGFVDRLSWSGATLYDLCNSRLRASTKAASVGLQLPGAGLNLIDLFAEDVSLNDLTESLEHMHQPRDAFKFLYRAVSEHCAAVTSLQNQWRIPRYILEVVKKQEIERVQALYRGIRPA